MNRKISVLFVGSFVETGKAGNVGGQMYACRSIINSRLSEKVSWILLDTTAPHNLEIAFSNRLRRAMARMLKFFWILLSRRVDRVLIFTSSGQSFQEKGRMALLARRFGKKVILAPRSGRILNDLEDESKRRFIEKVFANCGAVICQGESWRNQFARYLKGVNTDKYVVIKNWINAAEYERRNGYEKPDHDIIKVLFLGWIDKAKGVFEIADACERIKGKSKAFSIVMAGEGKDSESLKQYVEQKKLSSYFDFRGWVTGDDKKKVLDEADIFVLPSYVEGSPNSLKEAMVSGIPSIATAVGAIPEIISDEVNGFLVAPGDAELLADRMFRLISDIELRKKFAKAGIHTIRQEHDINSAISKLETLLVTG